MGKKNQGIEIPSFLVKDKDKTENKKTNNEIFINLIGSVIGTD